MVDQKKVLEVEITATQRQLEEEVRKASANLKSFSRDQEKINKVVEKHQKDTLKFDQKQNSPQKKRQEAMAIKDSMRMQKQKLGILREEMKAIKDLTKLQKELNKEETQGGGGRGRGGDPRKFSRSMGGKPTGAGVGGAAAFLGAGALAAITVAIGGLVQTVASQIREGYGQYSQYAKGLAGLVGSEATYGEMMGARQRGIGFGYGPQETVQQARQVALQTGQAGAVTQAQALSRMTMMDAGQSAGFMGTLARAGTGFGGRSGIQGRREMIQTLALGFESGLDRARMPEFFQGVGQLVQLQAGRQGGDVEASRFARVLQAMGATGRSGLQGARGGAVLQQLNEAIVRPGGGEVGQALALQAFGFGRPGGDATYYEALRRQEQGATPENIRSLFDETRGQYGGGEEQILALRQMTGLSITQLEGVREAVESLEGEAQQKKIEHILKESESIEEKALNEMQELGKHAQRIARLDERLVRIGEETRGPIESIQDSINELVMEFLPVAKVALEEIANLLKMLVEFTPGARKRLKEDADRSSQEALDRFGAAKLDFQAGAISAREFEKTRAETLEKLRRSAVHLGEGRPQDIVLEERARVLRQGQLGNVTGMGAFGGGRFNREELTAIQALMQDPALAKRFKRAADTPSQKDDENLARQFMSGGEFYSRLQEAIMAGTKAADAAASANMSINAGRADKASPPPATVSTGPGG